MAPAAPRPVIDFVELIMNIYLQPALLYLTNYDFTA